MRVEYAKILPGLQITSHYESLTYFQQNITTYSLKLICGITPLNVDHDSILILIL